MTAPLLSTAQVAERLQSTPRYVHRLAQQKRIAYLRLGHQLRFTHDAVEEFIAGKTVRAAKR